MSPLISIIIPNWNGREHLRICLDSLRAQRQRNFEIILVDNGSTDGSQQFIRDEYPEVNLIELGQNRGFTGACIAGYAVASGHYIVLLNNDTECDPEWLKEIVAVFLDDFRVGIVASKILLFDRRDHFHAAGDFVRLDGIPGNRGVWERDTGQYDQQEKVFSACGAAAAYRRQMLDEIGFLDPDFFFSCEDVDMGWRANLAGWQVMYVPTALVYHKLKATGGSVTGSFYDGRNFLYLLWKNYPAGLLRRHWRSILQAQMNITWTALRAWRGEASRARLRGQLAGLLGFLKMWLKRRQLRQIRKVTDDLLADLLTSENERPAHKPLGRRRPG